MSYMNCNGVCSTKTWWAWHFMKQRVLNPSNRDYPRYKDRTIDSRWMVYANFLADMGEKPEGLTLDRIDNSKGYCKGNCRWATPSQQAFNKVIPTGHTKLSVDNVRTIKGLLGQKTNRQIAVEFGKSIAAISSIRSGRAWKGVAHV